MTTDEDKSRAWRLSAGHLEAIAQDRISEGTTPEVWEYVLRSVVPSLLIEARAAEARMKRRVR